jgi:hypothetical protein
MISRLQSAGSLSPHRPLVRFARNNRRMSAAALQGFLERIAECNDAAPHLNNLVPFSIEGNVVGHVKPA